MHNEGTMNVVINAVIWLVLYIFDEQKVFQTSAIQKGFKQELK